jgi:hypothetical protein
MKFTEKLAALFCLMLPLLVVSRADAAPPLTTVQDILYLADGKRFNGMVIVQWRSFEASDTSNIATNLLQVRVVNGLLRLHLVPTTNASAGAYYAVRYVSAGKIQFTEAWGVPPTPSTVRVRDIRLAAPPGSAGGAAAIEIGDVTGLQQELDIRPVHGQNFVPNRAVITAADGSLEVATGDAGDCVRVDGSSGPCGDGGQVGVSAATFVDGETPAGPINGSNLTFTLQSAPNPAASLLLYRNGILQKGALDYTLTGSTVEFLSAAVPQSGDILLASYRKLEAGYGLSTVLCAGTGTETSATSPTNLATCVLPSGVLKAGDRLEIQYNYTHEGTATGFLFDVYWSTFNLATQTATGATDHGTGRVSIGLDNVGARWGTQVWGASLPMASYVSQTGENGFGGITIAFRGSFAAATTDTLTLRSYSVVRHPAP